MPPLPDHYNKSEIDHIEKVQRRAARFVTNWRNTSSVVWTGAVLKTCIKMFNLSCNIKRKLVIIQTDRLKSPLRQSQNMHSSSFIIPPAKTQQRQESVFLRYPTWTFRLFSVFFTFIIIYFCICVIFVFSRLVSSAFLPISLFIDLNRFFTVSKDSIVYQKQ